MFRKMNIRLFAAAAAVAVLFILGQFPASAQSRSSEGRAGSTVSPVVTDSAFTEYNVDMTKLGTVPGKEPVDGKDIEASLVGPGRAMMSVSPEIANINVSRAFATLTTGFNPGESVQYYLDGTLAATFSADADGKLAVSVNTGSGFGYVRFQAVGMTSGRTAAGAAHIDPTGPFVLPLAGGPHAINTAAGAKFFLYGTRYPVNASVPLFRNGVSVGNATTDANGTFLVSITPSNTGNKSVVYSAEPAGSTTQRVGISLEERADAGTATRGDLNQARAFMGRAMLNSVAGGTTAFGSEGFLPNEPITFAGPIAGTGNADANGNYSGYLKLNPNQTGVFNFTITGGTSGRVAYLSLEMHPNVTNVRNMIVSPGFVLRNAVPFQASVVGLPPSTQAGVYLDGVFQGNASVNADGFAGFSLNTPSTPGLHVVSVQASTGEVQSGPIFVSALTAANGMVSGRVLNPSGRGLTGAVVTLTSTDGMSRTSFTARSGAFTFDSVETGRTYIVSVASARFGFAPQTVVVNDSVSGLEFRPQ